MVCCVSDVSSRHSKYTTMSASDLPGQAVMLYVWNYLDSSLDRVRLVGRHISPDRRSTRQLQF
jgi:hypothetical protein